MASADFSPQLNPWFSASGNYAGPAQLEIENAPVIHGHGTVKWDATGECRIAVDVAPASLRAAAQFGMSDQHLKHFRLESADGLFETRRISISNTHTHVGESFSVQIELATLEGEFTPDGAARGTYWVAPLTNFISETKFRSDQTDHHPLRIFPTPSMPSEIPEPERFRILLLANSKNHLIPFEFEGSPAFIELLPDYKEQADLLKSTAKQRSATAIVVGALASHTYSTTNEVKSWFPFDLFYALSLASGTHVMPGFIEIRDSGGQLVKRFHIASREERYERGFRAIHEVIDSGSGGSATGQLLNALLRVTDVEKRRLIRVVIGHAVQAGLLRESLENNFDHVVRAIEALTKWHGLSSQNLLENVPSAEATAVKSHLATARSALEALAGSLRRAADFSSSDRVARIGARVFSADQKETGFGLAASSLLKKYGLPDESIVDNYYQSHPRADGMTWAQVLSAYRGDVIHIGYLELTSSAELRDAYQYIRHLHDLLVRMILIEIGYGGNYQPTVSKWANPKPPNWVSTATSITELGYDQP